MHTASSSRRTRVVLRAWMWLLAASYLLATMAAAMLMLESHAIAGGPVQLARFTEENLPAQDLSSTVATPEAGPTSEWMVVPASSSASAAPAPPAALPSPEVAPAATASPSAVDADTLPLEATPLPTPDLAPLEVGSLAPQIQISDSSLDSLIQSVHTTQPALAASLRVTDQARAEILNHHEGDAIQTLMRAMSIEGSNPYAYFYLGRAYLARRNYDQAVTFLSRAENRLGDNPRWLGETLAFEGLANEQGGQIAAAIACYQKALVAVPGNLMARVGLTRLGGEQAAPAQMQPVSVPGTSAAAPNSAPEGGSVAPPPAAPPPPPTNEP